MKKKLHKIGATYYAALKGYREGSREQALQMAYDIGRQAVNDEVSILDLISAYQKSFELMWSEKLSVAEYKRLMSAGAKILNESLSAFELVQGGLKEAIASLKIGSAKLSEANLGMNREIIERKHAEAQLLSSNAALTNEIAERKKVEKEVLEISQKEQRRFGAELHDSLCQKLVGISMLMKGMIRNTKRGGNLELSEVERISELVEQSAEQARDMAHGFFPVELKADALMHSLNELAKRVGKNYQIECKFHCNELILIEDNNTATHLFRIAQEAINNAHRHGEARGVEVRLTRQKDKVILSVQDNGRGFKERNKESPGIGLQIMKYRARMINADLQWQAISPHGVIVTCSLSLPSQRRTAGKTKYQLSF